MNNYCYKMIIEYDGTEFCGWQIQPRKRTVQDILQNAIRTFTREKIKLQGAGRTDTGVHALGQVASFSTDKYFEPNDICYRLNRILPDDVAVKKVVPAKYGFDPRRNAFSRTYRYSIAESPQPLFRNTRYHYNRRLDIQSLNKTARLFLGKHDFTSFCRKKSLKQDNHCEVYLSRWFRYGGSLIYEVRANRFLHNMVRRLIGAMLAVERSKLNLTRIKSFLNNKGSVRYCVPANGLVLTKVSYRRDYG
ncbi:MAG: tRNA pseudouridine(38-40) synthase TruA [candidate division Zixibacteria bacterium]|nr:tRNA pseudouridine(38-40) synthase TruA [candidate division Zixibacteria bacterium]